MSCRIRIMTKSDIIQVTAIDREAFPTMWPPVNFTNELNNRLAHYVVACDGFIQPENQPQPAIRLVPVRSFLGIRWPFNRSEPQSKTPVDYIIGFVGMWMMVDEVHIINLAVRESMRGKGIGETLLIASIDTAFKLRAALVTLEVRASNVVAQNLYLKYGFHKMGIRKAYYTDNKEDAWIMTTDIITSDGFKKSFWHNKEEHFRKQGDIEYLMS
ncbi:MAG TPA: ribosomal protein S18-alanine N-acetyltransferase [Dehalococcoidales bacterium]|nr:ribosomal protein S18-alanine N-acetyltransferase [Dehalococcoidales bacterium]